MLLRKQRKNRQFSYEPRYWDPKKEEELKRRMRFRRKSPRKNRLQLGFVAAGILLIIALYIYQQL